MGLLGKVGKGIGKAAIKAGKTGAAGIKKRKLQNSIEMRILARYKTEHFNKLLKRYGLEGPSKPERGYLKKEDYIDYVHDHFKLSTIIAFAEENRIPISDIMEDYKKAMELIEKEARMEENGESPSKTSIAHSTKPRMKVSSPPEPAVFEENHVKEEEISEEDSIFKGLLEFIEKDFSEKVMLINEPLRDEGEFEKMLFIALSYNPSVKNIKKQEHIHRRKVDLFINEKYALELKYADSTSTLARGVDEVMDYIEATPYVGVVILDVGELSGEKINDYKNKYEKQGASVVILRGRSGRKKKRRETRIIVKS